MWLLISKKIISLINSIWCQRSYIQKIGLIFHLKLDFCTAGHFDPPQSPHSLKSPVVVGLIAFVINPTRVTPFSKTIIDNIFSDSSHHNESLSGNIRTHITDHFAQYLVISIESKNNTISSKKFIRDTKNLNSQEYINDFTSINWNNELKLEKLEINKSFNLFEEKIWGEWITREVG